MEATRIKKEGRFILSDVLYLLLMYYIVTFYILCVRIVMIKNNLKGLLSARLYYGLINVGTDVVNITDNLIDKIYSTYVDGTIHRGTLNVKNWNENHK